MTNLTILPEREHGGDLDAAITRFGGVRSDWLDLSTGINPVPYPVANFAPHIWGSLPDHAAFEALESAARKFWNVPAGAEIVVAGGASALIAAMPQLVQNGPVEVISPTYNEHAAAFHASGRHVHEIQNPSAGPVAARICVHPNNPDGRLWGAEVNVGAALTIIDESFADVVATSHIANTQRENTIVLKSFGKFWGLAGARLGFAVCTPSLANKLRQQLGPWAASGPAIALGTAALSDPTWATETRERLAQDATALDVIMTNSGATVVGGTDLFRLYHYEDAVAVQTRLAKAHIWSRVFSYNPHWLRLGLPADATGRTRIEQAMI